MYTALTIGNHRIQVVSLNGRRVTKWATRDLEPGLVRDGIILKPEAVGAAIDELFTSSDIKKTSVIASIAGLPFTYRYISLPKIKSSLVEEALLRTAKKEISLPLEDLYLSWQPVPGKADELRYFVLGVPRNPVDVLLETLKAAGIESYTLELRPLALARAANRSDAIVISMESCCFDIVLVGNGLPVVIHTVTPRSEEATLEDNVQRLADELEKIIAFNQSNNPDANISPSTPLLITGSAMADRSASKLLKQAIEYPLEPLLPPADFPDDLPIAAYTTGIALALKKTPIKSATRGEPASYFDINLDILAGKNRKPKAKPIRAASVLSIALVIITIAVLLPVYLARNQIITDNSGLEDALTRVNRQLSLASLAYQQAQITEASLNETITTATMLQAAYHDLLSPQGMFNAELGRVTDVLPANTYFTSIEMLKDSVVIKGEADNAFTVASYAAALEAEGIFVSVRIAQLDETIVTLPGTGGGDTEAVVVTIVTFVIVCTK
jgi:Tfp pilus assembly protein PilN